MTEKTTPWPVIGISGGLASVREAQPSDQVSIRLPADGAYLSVLRSATAGLAARLDFTLDEIEDLRIAVDEACAMLLAQADPDTSLECDFTLSRDTVTIAVTAQSSPWQPPARDSFAWKVLTALAGSVDSSAGADGRVTIVMRKSRGQTGAG